MEPIGTMFTYKMKVFGHGCRYHDMKKGNYYPTYLVILFYCLLFVFEKYDISKKKTS